MLKLTPDSGVDHGVYDLILVQGADSNIVVGRCENEWNSTSLKIIVPDYRVDLGADTNYCNNVGIYKLLDAGSNNAYQIWHNGDSGRYYVVTHQGLFHVLVGTNYGCEDRDSVTVVEDVCNLGIENNSSGIIKVYPNPVDDRIIIERNNTTQTLIRLFDLNGSLVKQVSTTELKTFLDVETMNEGMYILEYSSGNVLERRKVVIKH